MIWNRIYALDLKYAVVISVIAVFIWGRAAATYDAADEGGSAFC